MTQPLCLIVAADRDASLDWRRGLEPWGFRPYAVPDVDAALDLLGQCRFDAVLVDGDAAAAAPSPHALPRGRPVLGDLHSLSGRTTAPILVVWSEEDDARQIDALARGAAATVVKPASPRLVGAKLKRLVEIARGFGTPDDDGPGASGAIVFGPLRLDASRAVATCAGRPIDFTTAEFALVAMLAARAGGVVERETIVRTLVAEGVSGNRTARRESHRSADMHVCRIRRKLEGAGAAADGVRLATVHGRGYALRQEPTTA